MKYLIVEKYAPFDHYEVEDLQWLIYETYSCELDEGVSFNVVKEWFYGGHNVFEITDDIKELLG